MEKLENAFFRPTKIKLIRKVSQRLEGNGRSPPPLGNKTDPGKISCAKIPKNEFWGTILA